jgi:hypothetical protein
VAVLEREGRGDPVPVGDRRRDGLVVVGVAAGDVVAAERNEVREAGGDRARPEQDQRSPGEADQRL